MLTASFMPEGFIWPGLAPREYASQEVVPMLANKLTSVRTQIPRPFYALPFCVPHHAEYRPESLGEVMNGNLVQNAAFELRVGVSRELVLCKVDLDHHGRLQWAKRVREDYRGHLLLDNLPSLKRASNWSVLTFINKTFIRHTFWLRQELKECSCLCFLQVYLLHSIFLSGSDSRAVHSSL